MKVVFKKTRLHKWIREENNFIFVLGNGKLNSIYGHLKRGITIQLEIYDKLGIVNCTNVHNRLTNNCYKEYNKLMKEDNEYNQKVSDTFFMELDKINAKNWYEFWK